MGMEFKPNLTEENKDKNSIQLKERLGFDEISLIEVQRIISETPKGKIFIVPNEGTETVYRDCAVKSGRGDIKFEVEK